jgi:hypothetical protein
LTQVLQRLQTAPSVNHAGGCQCLESDTPEAQEPFQPAAPIPGKGEAMSTSTFAPLTILSPSSSAEQNSADDTSCGCGCGCEPVLTQVVLPQDVIRPTGSPADTRSAQS